MWTTLIILGVIELIMFAGFVCSYYYRNQPLRSKRSTLSREDSLRLLYDDMATGFAEKPLWLLAPVGADYDEPPYEYKEEGRIFLPIFTSAESASAFAAKHPNIAPRAISSNRELLNNLDYADRVILDPGANTEWTLPPDFVDSLKAEINGQNG